MKNAAQPSSARARAAARHIGTYDTSVLVARMTRIRSDAGIRAMAGLWSLYSVRKRDERRVKEIVAARIPHDPHAAMGYTFHAVSRSMPDSFVQIEIPNRSLFKASEVCDLVKLQPYVLRSWEAEFPDLGVAKAGGGPRVYRRTDVEQVVRIKHLLLVEGLTLAGARRKLDEEGAPVAADQPAIVELSGRTRASG